MCTILVFIALLFIRYLNFYPSGESYENVGFAGLYLRQKSSVKTNFFAEFSLSIMNRAGNKTNVRILKKGGHLFESGWGYNSFISHKSLKELVIDDKITIACEVTN